MTSHEHNVTQNHWSLTVCIIAYANPHQRSIKSALLTLSEGNSVVTAPQRASNAVKLPFDDVIMLWTQGSMSISYIPSTVKTSAKWTPYQETPTFCRRHFQMLIKNMFQWKYEDFLWRKSSKKIFVFSLKHIFMGTINFKPALVQMMAWHRTFNAVEIIWHNIMVPFFTSMDSNHIFAQPRLKAIFETVLYTICQRQPSHIHKHTPPCTFSTLGLIYWDDNPKGQTRNDPI